MEDAVHPGNRNQPLLQTTLWNNIGVFAFVYIKCQMFSQRCCNILSSRSKLGGAAVDSLLSVFPPYLQLLLWEDPKSTTADSENAVSPCNTGAVPHAASWDLYLPMFSEKGMCPSR